MVSIDKTDYKSFKNIKMKNLTIAIVVLISLVGFSACDKYDDTYGDFDYTAIYFANPDKDRSVIIDEFDFIQIGCVLGGKISNDAAEWFQYELVDSLVTNAGYTVLPESLYTVSNNDYMGKTNTVEIPVGKMLGMMKVTLKPEFFSDTLAYLGKYALALRLLDVSSDSIGRSETIVTFKYLSSAIGVYTHSGKAVFEDSTITYENDDIDLTTTLPLGSNSVLCKKVSIGANDLVFNLDIDADNNITVTEGPGSAFPITTLSAGFFDKDGDNSIYLNYSFDDNGAVFEATDTLVFKKRTVDLVLQTDPRFF